VDGIAPPGTELFPFKDDKVERVLLQKRKIVTGDRVVGARSGFDEYSNPQVDISLDSRGGKLMAEATRDNVGRQMAVLFVEHKQRTRMEIDANGQSVGVREPYVEKTVINRATVQSMLGSQFRITGLDSPAEAAELALLLRAGALAAPMYFVEERIIGPSLGAENIERGFHATLWGFVAIAFYDGLLPCVWCDFGDFAVGQPDFSDGFAGRDWCGTDSTRYCCDCLGTGYGD
jgi:preprotein translocase subunit SecD